MPERHVVPDRDGGGWRIIGAEVPDKHTSTQAEAIEKAREDLERGGGGELHVHGIDSSVRETVTIEPIGR